MDERIELGATVRDRITGFLGVVTGRAEYLYGCTQLHVVAPLAEAGSKVESHWFDEPRLTTVDDV